MSILSDFDNSAYAQAKVITGTHGFKIGDGKEVDFVEGEARYERESERSGFDKSNTLEIVGSRSEFEVHYKSHPEQYEGKLGTFRGETWRVDSITRDVNYVSIMLIGENDAS